MCKGCKKKAVYSDPLFGPFAYCSPQCRDEVVLPRYNIELQKFVDAHSISPASLHGQESQPSHNIIHGQESQPSHNIVHAQESQPSHNIVVLKKKPREACGVLWSKTSGGTALVNI